MWGMNLEAIDAVNREWINLEYMKRSRRPIQSRGIWYRCGYTVIEIVTVQSIIDSRYKCFNLEMMTNLDIFCNTIDDVM